MTQAGLFDPIAPSRPQRQMRDHQESFLELIRTAARKAAGQGHRRIVGCASVGFGKTLCAADLLKSGYSKGKVSMFTVPRNALIEPSVEEFEAQGLRDIGIIQQNHPRANPEAKLQVASIHTAVNRELPAIDFAIVDEVHMMTEQFQALLDSPEWSDKIVIGLSATPWKKGMGLKWTILIQTKKTAQLIEEGYLVKPRYLVGSEDPNTKSLKTHLDEDGNRVLTEKDEAAAMGEQRIIGDIVKTYLKHGEERPGFYYAVNLAHARQLCEEFEKEGIPAGYIDGTMNAYQRNQVLRMYREGRFRIVVNYAVLTTGIDEDVRIIGICRIIKSETDWVQIIGRGLRTDNPRKRVAGLGPKTDCIARDSLVLTQDGLVKIQDITLDHRVWDGINFVQHSGSICKGIQSVIEHDGVIATPDHEVMTYDGFQKLADAKRGQKRIVTTGIGRHPVWFTSDRIAEDGRRQLSTACRCGMSELWEDAHGPVLQHEEETGYSIMSSLQSAPPASSPQMALREMCEPAGEMPEPVGRSVSRLRWKRGRIPFSFHKRSNSVDSGQPGHQEQIIRDRQNRQRWPLRAGQSSVELESSADEQYQKVGWDSSAKDHRFPYKLSQHTVCGFDLKPFDVSRSDGQSDNREIPSAIRQAQREVWDILNAGPLQRFTVNGKLVHNCLVIDHGGNLTRDDGTALAPAEDIYHDHLDTHNPADKTQKAFDEDLKPETHRKCKKCGALIPPRTKACPLCGDDSKPAFTGQHVEAEFSEFNGQKSKKSKKSKKVEPTMFQKQEFYSGMLTLGDQRGKVEGWSAHRYRERFGVWPNQLKKDRGPVSLEVLSFDKHARIKYAKSKAKENATA